MPSRFRGNLFDGRRIFRVQREFRRLEFKSRYLDHVKAQAVVCLLLDMYSNRPVAEALHDPAGALVDTCRYFASGEYRVSSIHLCPYFEIHGGARERIFQVVQARYHPPTVSKVPLVLWRKGMQFHYSTHSPTHVATSDVEGFRRAPAFQVSEQLP